jgi:hypothetical protein
MKAKLTDIYLADKQGHYWRIGAEGERAALSVCQDKHLVADFYWCKSTQTSNPDPQFVLAR